MNIRPIGKHFLFSIPKETDEPTQVGNIYIPKSIDDKKKKFKECLVVAIGKDCHLDFKIGDKILLKPYNQALVSYETVDRSFFIALPEDVLGVYED